MHKSPVVTIGLPVRNGAHYIRQALESALAQKFQNFEILVSDNASDDETKAICAEFTARDERVHCVRQREDVGGFRNFALTVAKARGWFFTFLAHDDFLHPDYLSETVNYLHQHAEVVLVSPDFRIIGPDDEKLCIEAMENIRAEIPWEERASRFFEYPISNAVFGFYGLMRTAEAQRAFASTPTPKDMLEIELPFLCRMATMGQIVSIPSVLRTYRLGHPTSYSVTAARQGNSKSLLRRNFDRFRTRYRSRKDQLRYLFAIPISRRARLNILLRTLGSYATFAVKQTKTAPPKVARALRQYLSPDQVSF